VFLGHAFSIERHFVLELGQLHWDAGYAILNDCVLDEIKSK
jgi:hypothetical protein